jgi:EmrB/QacA subfamily drug resistance transporter
MENTDGHARERDFEQSQVSGTWGGLERRWWTLIAVCGATFMLLVDITIVQVALPTIQRHLHSDFADLQWVIDAYALTLATLMLTWGAAADRFGRKRIFTFGLVVFTLASLLCALSNSSTFLIWARALQGVGGAAMFATGLALIAQDFHGPERGKAIAAWGATVGGAVAVGPLVGGALTSGLGWRWIFFVNLPIGVITFVISMSRMVNVRDPQATKLDLFGLASFSSFMFLLIFGFIRTNTDSWTSSPIIAFLSAAALMLIVFIAVELRQSRPMFELSLFRKPGFTGVCIATFAIGGGMFALFPFVTFYFQNDLGFSAIGGGIRLLPSTVLCFLVPLGLRSIADRLPPGLVLGSGLALTAAGLATMIAVSASTTWLVLIPGLILTGFGIGIANPAIARIALGVVPHERSGMASGISNTFRIGGIATGVAALGAIFEQRIATSLHGPLGQAAPRVAKVVASAGVRAAVKAVRAPGMANAARSAFASGFDEIILIGTVVVATGAVVGMVLVRARDFHQPSATPATTTPWHKSGSQQDVLTEVIAP